MVNVSVPVDSNVLRFDSEGSGDTSQLEADHNVGVTRGTRMFGSIQCQTVNAHTRDVHCTYSLR